jgi:hypothetical protein
MATLEGILQGVSHRTMGEWLKDADEKPGRSRALRVSQLVALNPTLATQRAFLAAKFNVADLHTLLGHFGCAAGTTDPMKLIDFLFKLPLS